MTTVIDLSRMPPPNAIEHLGYDAILAQWQAELIEKDPRLSEVLALESEPLSKLIQVGAYREYLVRQRANDLVRSLLLAFAQGSDLDHIGVTRFGVERLMLEQGPPPVYESDEAYLRRLLIAPDRFTTAGSEDSYVFHALTASGDVKDVKALNGGAGRVRVPVLARVGTGEASAELVATVDGALQPQKVRPLNDSVQVFSATVKTYQVAATLTVRPGPDTEVVRMAAEKAAQEYADSRHSLGVDMIRDAMQAALYVEGVEHVDMTQPVADVLCGDTEAPFCISVEVSAR